MRLVPTLLFAVFVGCSSPAPEAVNPPVDYLSSEDATTEQVAAWYECRRPEDALRVVWIAAIARDASRLSGVLYGSSAGKEQQLIEILEHQMSSEWIDARIEATRSFEHSENSAILWISLRARPDPGHLLCGCVFYAKREGERWRVDMQPLIDAHHPVPEPK